MTRTLRRLLPAALVGAAFGLPILVLPLAASEGEGDGCAEVWTTGYVRGAFSPWTADGTSVWADENLAAVDWLSPIPFGTLVWFEGYGVFRVADTGYLAAHGVDYDLQVGSYAEAYAVTGWRCARVLRWGW